MTKTIYLIFPEEKTRGAIGIELLRKVAEIHRQSPLEALFAPKKGLNLKMIGLYCFKNNTGKKIELRKLSEPSEIFDYIGRYTSSAYIAKKEEEAEAVKRSMDSEGITAILV